MRDDSELLRHRIRDLEEVHRLAQSLNSVHSIYETLETILDSCLKLCQADRAAILLFHPSNGETVETIIRSPGDSDEPTIDHRVNSLLAGWISHHKRPLMTNDVISELHLPNPSHQLHPLGPAIGVPLMVGNRMIGVINLVRGRDKAPFPEEALRSASIVAPVAAGFIDRAKMITALSDDNLRLHAALKHGQDLDLILGESPAITRVRELIEQIASSPATVLLIGESGTGKELVARAIHSRSNRSSGAFIALNCAAIPATLFESELFGHERGAFTGATEQRKGKFELAHGGTLFLDEISAMPLELQPKLLRILEERVFSRVGASTEQAVDVRVIAATNKDLTRAVQEGTFRDDLFHRLYVVPMTLPPLRERSSDISLLAQTFLRQFSGESKAFSREALEVLASLPWKGNVRELRNTVERISLFIQSGGIEPSHLQSLGIGSTAQHSSPLGFALEELLRLHGKKEDLLAYVEKQLVTLALASSQGKISEASHLLGIDRNALHRRIEKFGIKPGEE